MGSLLFIRAFQNQQRVSLFCQRTIFYLLILLCLTKQSFAQYSYIINTKEANIRERASAKSTIIGKAYYGDTVTLKYVTGNWYEIELSNDRTGFIYKTNLRMVASPVYQTEVKPVNSFDFSKWNFAFLFSATIKCFLMVTGIILFAILIIYYLK